MRPIDLQSDSHLLPDTLPTALRGPMRELIVLLKLFIAVAGLLLVFCKGPFTRAVLTYMI